MDTAIITALISAVVTLVGCIINNSAQQRKNDIEQDKRMTEITHANELNLQQIEASISQKIALLNEKFDELTRKVEKHNGLVERTYKLESDVKLMQEKQSVANHRIDDLEKKGTAYGAKENQEETDGDVEDPADRLRCDGCQCPDRDAGGCFYVTRRRSA